MITSWLPSVSRHKNIVNRLLSSNGSKLIIRRIGKGAGSKGEGLFVDV